MFEACVLFAISYRFIIEKNIDARKGDGLPPGFWSYCKLLKDLI